MDRSTPYKLEKNLKVSSDKFRQGKNDKVLDKSEDKRCIERQIIFVFYLLESYKPQVLNDLIKKEIM